MAHLRLLGGHDEADEKPNVFAPAAAPFALQHGNPRLSVPAQNQDHSYGQQGQHQLPQSTAGQQSTSDRLNLEHSSSFARQHPLQQQQQEASTVAHEQQIASATQERAPRTFPPSSARENGSGINLWQSSLGLRRPSSEYGSLLTRPGVFRTNRAGIASQQASAKLPPAVAHVMGDKNTNEDAGKPSSEANGASIKMAAIDSAALRKPQTNAKPPFQMGGRAKEEPTNEEDTKVHEDALGGLLSAGPVSSQPKEVKPTSAGADSPKPKNADPPAKHSASSEASNVLGSGDNSRDSANTSGSGTGFSSDGGQSSQARPANGMERRQSASSVDDDLDNDDDEHDEHEASVANMLAKSMKRTSSFGEEPQNEASKSAAVEVLRAVSPTNATSSSHSAQPGDCTGLALPRKPKGAQEIVTLRGKWDGKFWSGEWFSNNLPSLKAAFSYHPDSGEVDDEMEDSPCNICSGVDPDGFLFCDLCNKGFHAHCCGVEQLPDDDADWHCPNCQKVLKRYGNELPPSRHWKGHFEMSEIEGRQPKPVQETFELTFKYSLIHNEEDNQETGPDGQIKIGTVTGKGLNRFGNFQIHGQLCKVNGEYRMDCHKAYVKIPGRRRKRGGRGPGFTWRKRRSVPRPIVRASSASAVSPAASAGGGARRVSDLSQSQHSPSRRQSADHRAQSDDEDEELESELGDERTITPTSISSDRHSKMSARKMPAKRRRDADLSITTTASRPVKTPKVSPAAAPSEAETRVDEDPVSNRPEESPRFPPDFALITKLRQQVAMLESEVARMRGAKGRSVVLTDTDCFFAGAPADSEKSSSRLISLWEHLTRSFSSEELQWVSNAPRVDIQLLFRSHNTAYVQSVLEAANKSFSGFQRLQCALKGAGAVCSAVDRVLGVLPQGPKGALPARNALCIVHPSGNRVGPQGVVGSKFVTVSAANSSLFNHAAIGAIHAHQSGNEKVAVIDSSIIGGAGTERILQQYSQNLGADARRRLFYGGVMANDSSERSATSATRPGFWNEYTKVELFEPNIMRETWRLSFDFVLDALAIFEPSIVILSTGFEGIASEPGTGSLARLEPSDFSWLVRRVESICPRIVSVLEGGDEKQALSEGFANHATALVRGQRRP